MKTINIKPLISLKNAEKYILNHKYARMDTNEKYEYRVYSIK